MRQRFSLALVCTVLALVALVVAPAWAQGPASVQQSPTMLHACSTTTATAAVNNTATVTLTPPNGQFVYLCGLDITISQDATGGVASTNLTVTSTNFGGWLWKFSNAGTASTTHEQSFFFGSNVVKAAQAGTAVTFVSPAINLHAAYSITAYYYFAN